MKKKLMAGLATGLFVLGMTGIAYGTTITYSQSLPDINSPDTSSGFNLHYDFTGFDIQADNILSVLFSFQIEDDDQDVPEDLVDYNTDVNQNEFTEIFYTGPGSPFDIDYPEFDPGNYLYNFDISTFTTGAHDIYFDKSGMWTGYQTFASFGDYTVINPTLAITASKEIDPVPEPATMLLFGTGIVGLAGSRIRRKKKASACLVTWPNVDLVKE